MPETRVTRREKNAPRNGLSLHRFRGDIQGLRAIAVLTVLLFHAGLPFIPGGFVGVDVFFVISGFLITGLLIKELVRTGRISLPDFYVRRVRRILPAALTVIALTVAAGWMFLPLSRWESLGWTALWSALSVANWSLAWDSTDYFTAEADPSPLQHYWSLGVEEQYYLFWPLLIILVTVFGLRRTTRTAPASARRADGAPAVQEPEALARRVALRVAGLAVVVGGASFVHSVLYSPVNAGAAYFITTTRIWELAAGALLAAGIVLMKPLGPALRGVLGWLGVALILVAAFTFTGDMVFPGWIAVIPVLGSVLVILAGVHAPGEDHGWAPGAVLQSRPMQWIGDLSYSLYLVHWPLIAIVAWQHPEGLPLWLGVLLAVVSVPLAWLLRVAVEKPFMRAHTGAVRTESTEATARRRRFRGRAVPLLTGGVATAAVSALALTLAVTAAERTSAPAASTPVAGAGAAIASSSPDAAADGDRDVSVPEPALPPEDWDPVDELSAIAYEDIVPTPAAAGEDGSPLVKRQCHTWAADDTAKRCEDGDPNAETTLLLVGDSHIHHWSEAVVTAALERGWFVVSYAKGACPITTHTVHLAPEHGGPRPFTECTAWNENVMAEIEAEQADIIVTSASFYRDEDGTSAADGMAEGWEKLVDNSEHTVVIADPPHSEQLTSDCVERNPQNLAACTWDKEAGIAASGTPDILAAAEQVPEVEVIDLTDFICPGRRCAPVVGEALVFTDTNHMTATFSRSLAGPMGEHLDWVLSR